MKANNDNQRIDFLIELFRKETLTNTQHQELLELLAKSENSDKASDFLDSVNEKIIPTNDFFSTEQSEKIRNSIAAKIHTAQPKVTRVNFLRILSAAAVLLIVFSYVIYHQYFSLNLNTNQIKKSPSAILAMDVKPGGNQAILKLADNRTISLNSLKNGEKIDIGNVSMIKTNKGELLIEMNKQPIKNINIAGDNVLTTPIGGQYQVLLADGSKVWLNSASSLKFPSTFTQNERRVELVGEGYFQISKLKGHPFIVNAKDMEVEVLGTHFNINAYPDEQLSSTTLLEGSVKISNQKSSKILVPKDQARNINGELRVQKVDVEDVVAWKEGYFVFDQEDIHSVMRKLSRWYKVKVEYQNPAVNEQFVGTISKYNNISDILKMLQSTGTIKFKILPSDDLRYERRIIVMK